ncbi:MAG: hypothetical protein QXQ39_04925 [Conexivisphaerales archaeon]
MKFKTVKGSQYALFDAGNIGSRAELISFLDNYGVSMNKISALILSPLHFDYVLNSELFNSAKIYVSAREIHYFRSDLEDDLYYPEAALTIFS